MTLPVSLKLLVMSSDDVFRVRIRQWERVGVQEGVLHTSAARGIHKFMKRRIFTRASSHVQVTHVCTCTCVVTGLYMYIVYVAASVINLNNSLME